MLFEIIHSLTMYFVAIIYSLVKILRLIRR